MTWRARDSFAARFTVGCAVFGVVWGYVAHARAADAPCGRPAWEEVDGAAVQQVCPTTEQALRDQLKRERIAHQLEKRAILRANRNLRRTLYTQPSVQEAVTIASLVSGVPRAHIWTVVRCESGGDPQAQNRHSTAGGLVQYLDTTWAATTFGRAGLDRYSAYANVIQGALAMRHSMSPWAASRHCWSR